MSKRCAEPGAYILQKDLEQFEDRLKSYLAGIAGSLEAGDFSDEILSIARRYYGERIRLRQFDAQDMPFEDKSKDVIILFEAIYYIPDAEQFVSECVRVLRSGRKVFIDCNCK